MLLYICPIIKNKYYEILFTTQKTAVNLLLNSSNLFFNSNHKNMNEEQGIILERATFEFSQDGNCISASDQYESLTIECESSLGIDRDEDCFYVLKTEKWSVDNADDFKKLFDRIEKVILKKKYETNT